MKAMETVKDLIDEAKLRTVWWSLCIFAVSYFLSHTSKSMWMNLPMAILLVCGIRILFNEVEFRRKVKPVRPQSYLAHLEKKQLSVNDSRLSAAPVPEKWKRKIDSPVVEAAIADFIDMILKDFVVDLWYSDITPDKEFPAHIRSIIMDALGEVSGRVKEINLVDLLTRDIVDLVGDHLDLFRRNQAVIGSDVMGTLSSEERDERLKHHLLASNELHPALISPESEYKVLQRLMGGLLTVVLRPREAHCPVIRSISRELLTCLVIQPVMNFASPGYINELLEYVLLAIQDDTINKSGVVNDHDSAPRKDPLVNQGLDMELSKTKTQIEPSSGDRRLQEENSQPRPADWARILEAATQRRTEVLTPENLENMWTKGRNYRKKENKSLVTGGKKPASKDSVSHIETSKSLGIETLAERSEASMVKEEETLLRLTVGTRSDSHMQCSQGINMGVEEGNPIDESEDSTAKSRLKRSSSTSALKLESDAKRVFTESGGPIISEFYSADIGKRKEQCGSIMSASEMVVAKVGQQVPKLRCRVMGAYFEKISSKSFAVYSIAVTDAESRTWCVKRRYRNFERLHRYLKEIPNYILHLPPKRIFSSSTEDAFVHQRCIQLDKYLQDLLSIANVAEQHEVWDFLSASSKNYSFGKSSSVMRTLAVNVDDAVDDIVRQFKGVSDGLMRKVVGSTSPSNEAFSSNTNPNLSASAEEISKLIYRQDTGESTNSYSDNDVDNDEIHAIGWHSDNELTSKGYPPRVIKKTKQSGFDHKEEFKSKSDMAQLGLPATKFPQTSDLLVDPAGMPPEWTPPNVSVPLLNLVDKIFQLKRRGWLRRQVFWISKQILHLVMDDAIDDWLLRQIHWLRRDDIIALGIRWVQDILWPNGTFFLRIGNTQINNDTEADLTSFEAAKKMAGSRVSKAASFEQQLEAARRASDVKKMLFDGAPTTLVSLIGHKQYKRCAKDIYYFTQSTICVKQLGYAVLELLLLSIFPELRNLILDVHENTHIHQPV